MLSVLQNLAPVAARQQSALTQDTAAMDQYFDLNQQSYDWCVRAFDQVRKVLGVRIKMHHEERQIDSGDIFLFNHFARVETFIPQYLIYQETGAFCRSIAASQFFKGNDRFANALRELGVVPNDHPHLMEMLATDILRGRKIVVFPEGGMVKDRQVVDEQGRYSIYSRHAKERRKHHTGAARLAIGLHIFKLAVRHRHLRGDNASLERWAEMAGLGSVDELLEATERKLNIVPANITFYPLRISDNILRRSAELLTGGLSARAVDELVIEGNILLKATDMDINLGRSINIDSDLTWFERPLTHLLARDLPDLGAIFDIEYLRGRLTRRTAMRGTNHAINRIRDTYMQEIYRSATVNLSHLASTIILRLVEQGHSTIGAPDFRRALYLAVKRLQSHKEIRLHRGLCDPGRYQPVLDAEPSALTEFLDSAASAELIEHNVDNLRLLPKLAAEHEFDAVRLENPIEVYANEAEPLAAVRTATDDALIAAPDFSGEAMAGALFDDEIKAHAWDLALYQKSKYEEINRRETATADPLPFLLRPQQAKPMGIILSHGFLASPAEVRSFGEKLCDAGYVVLGVRLKGHGTSPWDLRDRSWRDWFDSIERARRIMHLLTGRYAIVGFSTGGSPALLSAAESSTHLDGVVSICAPIKFRNKNMRFVPLMHSANRIVRWLSSYEGVMPFRPNESEHPHINYRNMPLRGLYELTRVTAQLKNSLANVAVPTCLIQADADRVVDPISAEIAYKSISGNDKRLHWVESERHGILNENIGDTHAHVLGFLDYLTTQANRQQTDHMPEHESESA